MPIPFLAMAAASMLPTVVDKIFNSGDQRSGFEKDVEKRLRDIIAQGGIGLNQEQLGGRFKGMMDQLRPMFNAQRESYDQNAAGRGIYKSGVAFQKGQELGGQQSNQMAQMLQNLTQWNEEQKMNSLMSALGMGGSMAGQQGDWQRSMKGQNQGAFQDMWGNLLGLMVEKNMFKF